MTAAAPPPPPPPPPPLLAPKSPGRHCPGAALSLRLGPQAETLGALRAKIDGLDPQIVALLAERAQCVRDATRFKRNSFQAASPERQAQAFARVVRAPPRRRRDPLAARLVEAAYRVLVAGFIAGEARFFAETEPIPT